jgi:hypothetical protein
MRLYARLPNHPCIHIAPTNLSRLTPPFQPKLLFPLSLPLSTLPSEDDDPFDLTIDHAMLDAARHTGWDVKELRYTFPSGEEVWGFDSLYAGFKALREFGCVQGSVIDLDYFAYDGKRTVWGEVSK